MNRRLSPIRHDYRPRPLQSQRRRTKRLPWFAAGLGLPVLAVVLLLDSESDGPLPSAEAAPVELIEPAIEQADAPPVPQIATALEPTPARADVIIPYALPEPVYHRLELTVEAGDSMDRLFRRNDLSIADLTLIAKLPAAQRTMRLVRPGDVFRIEHDDDGRVMRLAKEIDVENVLVVRASKPGSFSAEMEERPVEYREMMRHGIIETSLFESAAQAGLDDNMIMNLAGIFAWDIDFVLDIRAGDEYYLLYEELWQDGRRVADGEIIAAEFINNGRVVQAVRHIDSDGRSDYFAPDGRSVRKAFIRAPVDFTRISSNFNPRRRHPVLNTIRAHRGVDYAAPKGTPIKASGDGKVIFRGRKGGYGNTVIIQHGGNISTLYAHMSSFARNARLGSRVRQGQVIGFVGATGLATAAHLHYEYRVSGVHRNPRTVKLPAAEPISDVYRDDFLASASAILERLDRYKQTRLARLD